MTDDAPPKSTPDGSSPNEPTVKQLLEDPRGQSEALDPATLAELQRWFGLPSAMDLPPPEPEPEQLSKREAAMAAVDPGFLDYLHRVSNRLPMMIEEPSVELHTKEDHATIAERFEGMGKLGEPREIEVSYLLIDDLKECVPQALLRDLHRLEEHYAPYYELTKVSEGIPDVRRDIQAAIERGEEERKQMVIRDELTRALGARHVLHDFSWAVAAKDRPAAAVESSPTGDGEVAP